MLSTDVNLKNSLMQDTSLSISNKLIIENNINDLASYIKVEDLSGVNDIFTEIFPPKSVVKSFRPSKAGIKYKILGENTPLATYKTKTIPSTRIYMADKSNDYLYFLRPTSAQLRVSYFTNSAMTNAQTVYTNKIVVKVETGHGLSNVNVKVDSTQIHNATAPADGVVTLWLNGSSWSTTQPATYSTPVSISTITVALTGTPYAGIIEISPRIVQDISNKVTSIRIDKDDSIGSDILPVGALTANSANIELFSINKGDIVHFNKGDAISQSNTILAKNSKLTVSFIINNTYTIQQGVFYGVDITSKDLGEFSIKALDGAKFLQETPCPEIILTDSSFQAVLWRMLDAVGFTAYDFSKCTGDIMTCRYWWGNKSQTVWQAIQEICRETQTVAFFNEFDTLCFISRDKFYDSSATTSWQFLYADEGSNKANIESLNSNTTPTSSAVRIKYNVPITSNLERSTQPIWTEQAPSTLFASPFQGIETVGATQYLKYSKHGVFGSVIPTRFNSYVLVGSEIIEYDGIEFAYPAVTPETSPRIFETLGEYLEVRARYSNNLVPTGRLRIKTRGAFGTAVTNPFPTPSASNILSPFTAGKFKLGTSTQMQSANISTICKLNYSESNISSIAMSPTDGSNDLYILTRSMPHSTASNNIVQYGTAAGFQLDTTTNSTSLQQTAGFAINWNSSTMSGYIVLVDSTRAAQETKSKVEVQFIKLVNGTITKVETVMSNVFEQAFFGIDVVLRKNSTSNDLLIYVNGSEIKITDDQPLASSSTIGLICGGKTTAYFDYVYSGPLSTFAADITGSRSSGKITAGAFFKNFKFDNTQNTGVFVDEFGPVIREIYKATPTYNQSFPVFSEASNPLAVVVSERLGHFNGEVYVFNTSSSTIALADGDGKEFAVWGIAIANAGENIYETEKNVEGVTEFTTFETNWIQSESSAKSLADFLSKQWSKSIRDVDMSIFGNPILQVGDIVTIKYTDRDLQGTEKFVVRAISHNFSGGLETEIRARSIYSA